MPLDSRFLDITGYEVGHLKVREYAGFHGTRHAWLCDCVCGNTCVVPGDRLRGRHKLHCGCKKGQLPRKIIAGEHETKLCTGCREVKPLREYYVAEGRPDGHESRCIACMRAYNKSWVEKNKQRVLEGRRKRTAERRKKHPRKFLDSKLKCLYGITLEQYEQMVVDQGNACALCGKQPIPGKVYKKRFFDIDHDHETGKVRGLLCHSCNLGLGGFQDSIEALENAIEYLKRHSNTYKVYRA